MLQRGFMGAFDIRPDKVAFAAPSVTNATLVGVELQSQRKNLLERILSVICDVCPGEGLGALILTINLFTLLGAYYLLKTVRESLILAEGEQRLKRTRLLRRRSFCSEWCLCMAGLQLS